jgi:membrane associated rhomboid family serine protease
MGIYDRDYYREDSRWHNPFARSQATLFLVLVYCFLFIAQIATQEPVRPGHQPKPDPFTDRLELSVEKVLEGEVWRVVSYAFVHQPWGIFHILFTVVFLVWIGHQVEDLYGSKEYLAFFGLTTLLGGIAYTAVGALTAHPPPLIGPSGALTAILVLFALHYPTRTITVWVLPIPVWLLVVGYALVDIMGLAHGGANPAAVAVHLVGAAFAFVYHTYTLRVLNWLPGGRGSSRSVRRVPTPKISVPRERPEPEPAAAASTAGAVGSKAGAGGRPVDEHLEAKLDEVLQKVARSGKESLTEDERDILMRASEVYKKKRRPG